MLSDHITTGGTRQPVEIHLSTTINQSGNISNYNFAVHGQLFQMGDNVYLRFMEDDQKNGHPVPMTIRINANGHVKLTRSAPGHQMRFYFIQGKRVKAEYQTPYGLIPIETETPTVDLQYRSQPFSGNLGINYNLYANQHLLGHYQLRLQFTV